MQNFEKIGLPIIGVLILLIVAAWGLILTGNFPDVAAMVNAAPTATVTPTRAPTETTRPPTAPSSPTPRVTATATPTTAPTATPPPPFPTVQGVKTVSTTPKSIVYMSFETEDWEIVVADVDGSNPRNISQNPGLDAFPAWSAQSEAMLWSTNRFGLGLDLVITDLEGNDMRNLSNAPDTDDFVATWSPNGQLIAFVSTRYKDAEIFVSTLEGALYNVSNHESNDLFFGWAPECTTLDTGDSWGKCSILMGSDRGSVTQDLILYTVSPDGSQFTFVQDNELSILEAAYSPDGKQIVYLRGNEDEDEDESYDLYLWDTETETETQLTDDIAPETSIAWSPAGGVVAYLSEINGSNDLYRVDVTSGEVTNLSNTPFPAQEGINGDFSWSPDGSQILFSTDRDDNVEIYVMDADGSNQTNLTNTPHPEIEASWVW